MEQFNLSKREGFQGFQAKSPSAAQSNFNWICSLFAGWADSLWHLKARFERTGWGHSWTGDVYLSHSFFCVFYTRQSEEGEVLPLHPWSTWVLLWWAPGQIHVHNSTWSDTAHSPEDSSSVMESKTMLLQSTRGHPPKHLGRLLHFHFWRGQGSISLRKKEWQDRRNPGLEAQWGGSVGTLLESPHLHICCTLPTLTIMAPHLLPLGLSHSSGWLCPFPFPSLNHSQ